VKLTKRCLNKVRETAMKKNKATQLAAITAATAALIMLPFAVHAQEASAGGGATAAAAAETPATAPAPEAATAGNTAEKPAVLEAPKDDEPLEGVNVVTSSQDRFTVVLEDVEMADVVKMFTRLSKANIIANPSNLIGRVTVNLTDVEWQPALAAILGMHNLEVIERPTGSGVFVIVPKEAGKPEPMFTETYFLKYATVSNVNTVVNSMIAQGGKVSLFPSRNALVVRSTRDNLNEIRKVIDEIDKIRDQVFIEAKFMELTDEAIKDLGINWQVLQAYNASVGNLNWDLKETRDWNKSRTDRYSEWDRRNRTDTSTEYYDKEGIQQPEFYETTTYADLNGDGDYSDPGETTTTITPSRSVVDTIDAGRNVSRDISDGFTKAISDIRTAVLGVDDFKLILSFLKQMNGVSIVSNPKIIVANEEPAVIHIGQTERPFVSSVTPGQQGIAPVVTYNPGDPVELGVKLTVTPTVNTESNITVRIQPELTRFLRDAVAPNGQTYPVVGTKKITTVFCLESGKTVAIGGLTETEDRLVTTKLPLLGDIPLIGKYLFSHEHKDKQQRETIIFVTVGLAQPSTIEPEAGIPEETQLTHRQLIESKARRAEFRALVDQARQEKEAETEKRVENARKRLMNKK